MDHSKKSHSKFLFNPFSYFSKKQTLIIGLIIIFIAGIINYFTSTHFDGIFDIHTGRPSPFIVFLLEGYINLIIITGSLLILGKLFTKQNVNILNFLGQQALARWPLLIASIITISKPYQNFISVKSVQEIKEFGIFSFNSLNNTIVSLSLIFIFVIILWMIILMYKSFKQTFKVQGIKGAFLFISGSIIAEIISKLIILRII
jgi:hypothetical protein